MKKSIYYFGLWSLMMISALACSSDDDAVPAPVASFQAEADATSFLQVTFTNFSTNFATSAWEFGDGEVSADANPVHTYAEPGTYSVTLTVLSASGVTATITKDVPVVDPDQQLALLAGTVSKTWKLYREGTSMSLGESKAVDNNYWAGLQNDGTRPCLYEQTFTFNRDGSFVFDDMGMFWGEYGVWSGALLETCFEAIPANMVNADGVDVSAWLSGTHSYTYDAGTGKVELVGEGAWMGIPKLGPAAESTIPLSSTSFIAEIVEEVGYDVLTIGFAYDGAYWVARYASYSDASLEPALVLEYVAPPCEPLAAVAPTEISHTFASNDAAEWKLLQFDVTSGAGLTLGVANPDVADVNTPLVGEYTRNVDVQYQELQFRLDPANAIDFTNLTTITMDVYMPSTNAYDPTTLTDNVFVGLGATTCPPNWWEDQIEYQQMAVAKDQWVTLTFQLDTPAYAAGSNTTPYARNDFDMIYIAIGGGGHGVGATFYIRNFAIK